MQEANKYQSVEMGAAGPPQDIATANEEGGGGGGGRAQSPAQEAVGSPRVGVSGSLGGW